MEEKREPLSEMAIERKIQILRNKHMNVSRSVENGLIISM